MSSALRDNVTRLLGAVREGNEGAMERLFGVVYEELRGIAIFLMQGAGDGHTLQPTALVNEAYLKLFGGTGLEAENRGHFFAAAARAMRQVLVDHARKRNAAKRLKNWKRVPLDDVLDSLESEQKINLLDLHEALERLEQFGKRQHDVVMLRFFGGLTHREIASHLNVSLATVESDWRVARSWLHAQVKRSEGS